MEQHQETLSQVLNAAKDIMYNKADLKGGGNPGIWHYQSARTFLAKIEAEIVLLQAAYEDKGDAPNNVEHSSRIVSHALNAALELIKFAYVEGDL